jgi:hypothetical protein
MSEFDMFHNSESEGCVIGDSGVECVPFQELVRHYHHKLYKVYLFPL